LRRTLDVYTVFAPNFIWTTPCRSPTFARTFSQSLTGFLAGSAASGSGSDPALRSAFQTLCADGFKALPRPFVMNAPLHPEVFLSSTHEPQLPLPLATDGVQRWVWQGRFGAMLIEVLDGEVFVNSSKVEPLDAPRKE
jgi:hypothetical protein